MQGGETPALIRWVHERRTRRMLLVGLIVIVAVQGFRVLTGNINDFDVHRASGGKFLAGKPTEINKQYPVSRAMLNSVLMFAEPPISNVVFLAIGFLALWGIFRIWERVAGSRRPIPGELVLPAVLLTLLVMFRFTLRDLDESGQQILLLLMLSLGLYAFHRGRRVRAGIWLAVAAAYKVTPLLFLPLLLWKREWRTAGTMAVCFVGLNLLPAVYLGWNETLEVNRQWAQQVATIMKDAPEAYPSLPGIELPKHQNQSLLAASARFLEHYPQGHPLHLKHPLFFQFGNLPAKQAKLVVRGLILLLGAVIAFRMRKRWGSESHSADLATDWAIASLFVAILSPLCWKQHLVLLIPVVYLISRSLVSGGIPLRRQRRAMVAVGGVFLLTSRTFVGQELSIVIMSYNIITFAALGLVVVLFTLPETETAAGNEISEDPVSCAERLRPAA